MKRIAFLLFLLAIVGGVSAQVYKEQTALSLFTGGFVAPKNTNANGYWYGGYGEFKPISNSSGLRFGFCGLASWCSFKNEMPSQLYTGKSRDLGIGLCGGKYNEYFTTTHSSYLGFNLIYKFSRDFGQGETKDGVYEMTQNDQLLGGEINFALLKVGGYHENLFPRTQFRIVVQTVLNSSKEAYWNKAKINDGDPWKKGSTEIWWRQGLTRAMTNQMTGSKAEFRLLSSYAHYQGDNSNYINLGPEIGFQKDGQDDWLTIYCLWKKRLNGPKDSPLNNQIAFGLNFLPFNLKSY